MSEPLSFFGKNKLDVLFLLSNILDTLLESADNDVDAIKEELLAYEPGVENELLNHYQEMARRVLPQATDPVERLKETALAVVAHTRNDVEQLREDLLNATEVLQELRNLAERTDIALSKHRSKDIKRLVKKLRELVAEQETYLEELEKNSPKDAALITAKNADLGFLKMFLRLIILLP